MANNPDYCVMSTHNKQPVVKLVVRQKGSRRMGLPVEFPLIDSEGVRVVRDRRRLPDRRKPVHNFDDFKVIVSKMGSD